MVSSSSMYQNILAQDTYNGKPLTLRWWIFGIEIYLNAYHLDKDRVNSEYCHTLVASLLRSNGLSWYCLACLKNPGSIPKKTVDLVTMLEYQFGIIKETQNAKDKLWTLR